MGKMDKFKACKSYKSPFRYPGGKGKIMGSIMGLVDGIGFNKFVDCFVGGGSVFLGMMGR